MNPVPEISLVLCTRNRGERLLITLQSISHAARAAPHVALEVLLVDNGSTDNTHAVADAWACAQDFPVKVLYEKTPGLARARNIGLRHMRGRIIAMTDDDCVVHSDYVSNLLNVFSLEAGPAVIGGRIELGDPEDLPVTINTGRIPTTLDPTMLPMGLMGANLAFTSDVIDLVGPFDEDFGAGAKFIAAEDTDFLLRASGIGVPLRYDPSFAVDHFHGRRRFEEALSLAKGYNFGDGALYAKHLATDPRIREAIKRDLRYALRDIRKPSTSQFGIRPFALFKAFHRARGFIAFRIARKLALKPQVN